MCATRLATTNPVSDCRRLGSRNFTAIGTVYQASRVFLLVLSFREFCRCVSWTSTTVTSLVRKSTWTRFPRRSPAPPRSPHRKERGTQTVDHVTQVLISSGCGNRGDFIFESLDR